MTFITGYVVVLVEINIQLFPSVTAELLGRVVQSPIKLTQDKREI